MENQYNPYFMDSILKSLQNKSYDQQFTGTNVQGENIAEMPLASNHYIASGAMGRYVAPVSYEPNALQYDSAMAGGIPQEGSPIKDSTKKKKTDTPVAISLDGYNDEYGRMNYSGNIQHEGKGYTYGVSGIKTEGVPIKYSVYGGAGNDKFNAGAYANTEGGFGVSGQYIPLGLQAYYNYIKGQNPNYGVSFEKQYRF